MPFACDEPANGLALSHVPRFRFLYFRSAHLFILRVSRSLRAHRIPRGLLCTRNARHCQRQARRDAAQARRARHPASSQRRLRSPTPLSLPPSLPPLHPAEPHAQPTPLLERLHKQHRTPPRIPAHRTYPTPMVLQQQPQASQPLVDQTETADDQPDDENCSGGLG